MRITNSNVMEIFDYDPIAGELSWKVSPSKNVEAGSIAGRIDKDGYIQISYRKVSYLAHRVAWLYMYGKWPDDQIDHRDGNRANNAIANLREASCSENMQNIRVAQRNNKIKLLGVTHSHNRVNPFRATICLNRKCRHLGYFATKEEAHSAYLKAKSELHPFSTIGNSVAVAL